MRSAAVPRAVVALGAMGYEDLFASPIERRQIRHARNLHAPGQQLPPVDLHSSFHGVRVEPGELWRLLEPHRTSLELSGADVQILDITGSALVLGLHASAPASSGGLKAERDLARALNVGEERVWVAARDLARELDALPSFELGVRSLPAGDELGDRLGWEARLDDPDALLRAAGTTEVTGGIRRLRQAPGWRARTGIVASELVPSRRQIERWAGRSSSGMALLGDYLRRLAWLAGKMPAALVAVRRAERDAAGEGAPIARFAPANLGAALWALLALRRTRVRLPELGVQAAAAVPAPPPGLPARAERGVRAVLARRGANCMERGLVLQCWRAAHDEPVELVVGVSPPDDRFRAHAWLAGEDPCHGTDRDFTELLRCPPPRA